MRRLALLASLGLIVCAQAGYPPLPAPPTVPENAIPLRWTDAIYAAYAHWWGQVEECSGIASPYDMRHIKFYVVLTDARHGIRIQDGAVIVGLAYAQPPAIVLASPYVLDSQVVRHEMLHHIASMAHDPLYFKRRCGKLVICEGSCAREDSAP